MSAVLDFPIKPEARPYLDAFGRRGARDPDWLTRERRRALSRFAELGFPTRRSEGWRYLDLQPLQQKPLLPAEPEAGKHDAIAQAQLAGLELPGRGLRLVILDGRFAPELSNIRDLPAGLWFGATHRAMVEREDLFREVAEEASGDAAHPFAALNAAFFADGYILDIGPGLALQEPIEIVHLATGAPAASLHTRSLVSLGEGACATVLEAYAGEGHYWRNDVVAVRLGSGAELSGAVLIEESTEAVHLAELNATLGADAHFTGFALLLGGGTVRQEASVQ
ncbi:MAG TPA: SufD family Fe-S cluster assembly protein, partial [Stellaceae bacterium]|nr:SufD family Fe-S cluster assembly protein [Stellaceae bacterium]